MPLCAQRQTDADADFRLVVGAARRARIDTLPEVRQALDAYRCRSLRQALVPAVPDGKRERVKVLQVCRHLPQNVTATALDRAQRQMDSLYRALQADGSAAAFERAVTALSDEKSPRWIAPLQTTDELEDTLRTLPVGLLSRPFFTPQGLHIVKVLERKEEPCFAAADSLPYKVEELKKRLGYQPQTQAVALLLKNGAAAFEASKRHDGQTPLFLLAGKPYTVAQFRLFASAHPLGVKRQFEAFVTKSVLDCAADRPALCHPAWGERLQAYSDTLLHQTFERKMLPCPDDATLEAYFKAHRSRYNWQKPRFKGIVLHAQRKRVAKQAARFLKGLPYGEWQQALHLTVNAEEADRVLSTQAVFCPGDNPYVDEQAFKGKKAPEHPTHRYTRLLGKKLKGPESWQEVRERVEADCIADLRRQWIASLRAGLKVEIDQEDLKTVNNH